MVNPSRSNENLQNAIINWGLNNIVFIVFDFGFSSAVVKAPFLEALENLYLQHFPVSYIYNVLTKAYSSIGFKHSDASKRLISLALKGKPLSLKVKENLSKLFSGSKNPFYGKQHSADLKQKLRILHLGEGNPMFGKPKSAEFTRQQARDKTGVNNHMSQSVSVTDLITGEVQYFPSIQSCSDSLCSQRSHISKVINGKGVYKHYHIQFKVIT